MVYTLEVICAVRFRSDCAARPHGPVHRGGRHEHRTLHRRRRPGGRHAQGGFRHLLAVEYDARACQTLRAGEAVRYSPGEPFRRSSTTSGRWSRATSTTWNSPLDGRVDVVAGGVPCQPWCWVASIRGSRIEEPWPELFRCVRETKPRAILAENVKGLATALVQALLRLHPARVGRAVRRAGRRARMARPRPSTGQGVKAQTLRSRRRYDVKFKLLVNAADYGVPRSAGECSSRLSARISVSRTGVPAATHSEAALWHAQKSGEYWERHGIPPRRVGPSDIPTPDGLKPWRTVRDAIEDLPAPLEPLEAKREHPDWLHHYGWPGAREYPGHTPNDLDKPAKTVKAGVHGVPGGETVLRLDDGSLRYMTVREVARVMTFPDDGDSQAPRGEQMRQLGNAVPVSSAWHGERRRRSTPFRRRSLDALAEAFGSTANR